MSNQRYHAHFKKFVLQYEKRTQVGRRKREEKRQNTSPISLFGPSKEKIREKTGYLVTLSKRTHKSTKTTVCF
ncbi:hypothetical protein C2G38_2203847 [Gigaspora rosea]|uniref:Uncharacterized protein n=1 Tax=Gigaspora rosea TaxID=44941 RepID=A0A397UM94_9GLOM|nr:hypothetical protein C2G38_2203847 [Gigaspora rosea]